MKSLKVDLTQTKNDALYYSIVSNDIEVIKYVSSIDGIQLDDKNFLDAINYLKFDIVVHLLNVYLCQSIPSHLHNQFHIFQFVNHFPNHNQNNNNNNNNNNNKIIR